MSLLGDLLIEKKSAIFLTDVFSKSFPLISYFSIGKLHSPLTCKRMIIIVAKSTLKFCAAYLKTIALHHELSRNNYSPDP